MDESMAASSHNHIMPPPSGSFTTPCRDMGIDALKRVTNQILTEVQTLVGAGTRLPGIK